MIEENSEKKPMKYTALFIAALLMLGIFVPFASAETGEMHLSPSNKVQMMPRIWESSIVWEDYRNDPKGTYSGPGKGNPDIYLYNVSTGKEMAVCTEGHAQQNPDIWKNLVVWEDYRNGNSDIYIRDMSESSQDNGTRLTFNSNAQLAPRIWGHYVVWIDYRNGLDGDVYAYDLSVDSDNDGIPNWKDSPYGAGDAEMAIKPICTQISEQRDVAIWGNIVVWKDYRNDTGNGDRNIFGYDLDAMKEFQITNERHNQFNPAICEKTVVWADMRGGVATIYGKNLDSGDEFRVAPDGMAQTYPSIYNNTVAWIESNGTKKSVKYADIGGSIHSIESGGEQTTPALSSLGLVWSDGRNVKEINRREIPIWNIYLLRSMSENRAPVISGLRVLAPENGFSMGKACNITVNAAIYDPEGDNFTVETMVGGISSPMYDDGKHGDGNAGDGIYGAIVNITPTRSKIDVTVSATDEYGSSSSEFLTVDVVTQQDAEMTLIGVGAVIFVLFFILAAIYILRKRNSEEVMEEEKPEEPKDKEKGN